MKKTLTVLCVLGLLAWAAPAYATNDWIPTGEASWHLDENWTMGQPTAANYPNVTNGGTAVVTSDVPATSYFAWVNIGGRGFTGGTIRLESGKFHKGYNAMQIGYGGYAAGYTSAFVQTGGTIMEYGEIRVAPTRDWGDAVGYGEYHISGGAIYDSKIDVGVYRASTSYDYGYGLFEVIGAAANIGSSAANGIRWYKQGPNSTLKVVPDSNAALSVIKVGGTSLVADATLAGTLLLDDSNFTPIVGVTDILVLTCTGVLDTSALSFSSVSGDPNWQMYTTAGSGALGVRYVPEPATLAILALGGLGVLLRRRRK